MTGSGGTAYVKCTFDIGDATNKGGANNGIIYPAFDMRTSTTAATPHVINWVNPSSVQIFSAGLDTQFGAVPPYPTPASGGLADGGLAFPTGENYVSPYTYDDITNFSSGKLESAMP